MLGCIRYTRAVASVTVVRQLVPPTPRLRRPKPTRMRLKPDIIPYLLGEKFSNGLMVEFDFEAEDSCVRSRIDWLELLCTDKKVIHAGCVDHNTAQIEHKLKRNKWVHARLCECANRCLGIDKSAAGISYLQNELGYHDVECLDLVSDESHLIEQTEWDFLLLGEVLEHIDDPVRFLRSIRKKYAAHVKELLITVPNAFGRDIIKHVRQNKEPINTDHRYWFTPYTLAKVACAAGLKLHYFRLCQNGVVKRRSWLKNLRLKSQPLTRNNIILVAGFDEQAALK